MHLTCTIDDTDDPVELSQYITMVDYALRDGMYVACITRQTSFEGLAIEEFQNVGLSPGHSCMMLAVRTVNNVQ